MFSDKLTFAGGGDEPIPDAPGVPFGGGYYAGKININGKIYALVVAPAVLGGQHQGKVAWKNSHTLTPGAHSFNDGAANTQAMVDYDIYAHHAARWCVNLTIGGHNDWYLPSINELEVAYRNLKPSTENNAPHASNGPNIAQGYNPDSIPIGAAYTYQSPAQTSISAFIAGGVEAFYTDYSSGYWTSTQYAPNPSTAWFQNFSNGRFNYTTTSTNYFARAFRRVLIS